MLKILTAVFAGGFALSLYAQADTIKTLKGGGVDQGIADSLGLVNPELQKKYNEGVRALTAQSYMESVQKFTEAILLDENYVNAYFNRGMAFKGLKKNTEAIADFDKVITLDPANDVAAFSKAQIYEESGDFASAAKAYKQAGEINRANEKYPYYQGVALFQLESWDDAIAAFDEAIRRKPDYAYAYNDRGSVKMKMENYDGAIADYTNAVKYDANLHFAYNNLGSVYRKKQDYNKAELYYTEAIKRKPDYYLAYNNRGTARFEQGKYNDALSDFSKAAQLNPEYAFAYNNQASVYIKMENYAEAVKACDKAIALNAEYTEAYFNRGIAKEMLKDLDGACADWQDAFILGSENAEQYINSPACNGKQ